MSTAPRPGEEGGHGVRGPHVPGSRVSESHVPESRVPAQRAAVEGGAGRSATPLVRSHPLLKSLLGAWALAACSPEETAAVEAHLTDCAPCADEAVRLRDAVALLHPEDSLDLDPGLRARVLTAALNRRPARIPVPEWAAPYEAEASRLDALLRDIGETEWRAPVRLGWFDGRSPVTREVTVADVIGHLTAVDTIVAGALGMADPLRGASPEERTEALWAAEQGDRTPASVRAAWRDQEQTLIRTVSFAGEAAAELPVDYGPFALPLRDAFLDRAFECWTHAGDIAEAVDYPYAPPSPAHLNGMIDLAARMLPGAIAARRRAGLAPPARGLVVAGAPGRALHLEIEGRGGGHWYIALDSPGATGTPEGEVAHVALDGVEFCRLAAGHVPPEEAAAGSLGDEEAVRDVLYATASLSRL
ncbi:maleylpyruvate isomerase N-terminal domain-containing protein [Streptomyces abikoensis]|uniref:maleylpyruvate isomerase N-terminal domain-containing protein n=1 Tax=Streptomyces abikoensis TaxID=97398 RepID=UPI001678EEEC|nr:maleylpyruvate isomerase N-terminal domain-containing protein [Streptomyces abikoensis]